jgi:hypothetical protein
MRAWIEPMTRRSSSVRNAIERITVMNNTSATTP